MQSSSAIWETGLPVRVSSTAWDLNSVGVALALLGFPWADDGGGWQKSSSPQLVTIATVILSRLGDF